ncbi:scarecrow-like protein 33 [Amaranthus tricolor]|uniref:scarecrow-like protein 33 n=1 Tax=Amaranthus tricolor TaxID=29722 RepID=UPI00258A6815|nr:scarecrow-like protein 33 [Amaranthus tricolor]
MGSQYGEFPENFVNWHQTVNGVIMSPGYDESLNYANLFNYKDSSQDLTSLNIIDPSDNQIQPNSSSFLGTSQGVELFDDSDSDGVLKYISQILMEEDMEQKTCMLHDALALQAAEKPFYDALGKKYPTSPDQHPRLNDHHWSSPSDSSGSTCSSSSNSINSVDPTTLVDLNDHYKPLVSQSPRIRLYSHSSTLPDLSFGSLNFVNGSASNGSLMSSLNFPVGLDFINEKESIIQFQKGMEEASKFLPKNNNIVINLENITFPNETRNDTSAVAVKKEKGENSPDGLKGSKIHYREDEGFEEGRSSKQSAVSVEEAELSEMFDKVLLCSTATKGCLFKVNPDECVNPSHSLGLEGEGKGRPRKQSQVNDKNMVDLRTLLVLCAQSTASDDRRTAEELLKQIRENSSAEGDGSQRLAHYFANALEARLAGTGSQIYTALKSKRTSAADMLKAYQFFVRTCPLKKISIGFANHLITEKIAVKASKLHVIDFGILYGFQWPGLIQRLSLRAGGPPKLCITGIDLPQPGFRPAERVEATGRRLAKYCERFNVPFEYHAVAQKWETITIEDLKIESDAVVAVNCLYRFKNLFDETIVADSPRNAVLNLVRKIKPDIFVHGVVNGSYNAPFFVTRFREVLFHFSTLFDMFDTNTTRDDPERLMFEKESYGREIMNVVACEGTERVERPETYKQWQVRNNRAGFRQMPIDQDILGMVRCKVKAHYHRDFVIDVDGCWLLQGWKGRITHAISAWVPA